MERQADCAEQWERFEKLARKAKYRPGKFAQLLGVPPWQLRRDFKRRVGCSPRDWLNDQRLRAVERTLSSSRFVKAAASEACFAHPANFSRWFKSKRNQAPSRFAPPVGSHPV